MITMPSDVDVLHKLRTRTVECVSDVAGQRVLVRCHNLSSGAGIGIGAGVGIGTGAGIGIGIGIVAGAGIGTGACIGPA